jgi:uncharacterized protein involved in exopolysaccharide biosynthesis
MSPSKPRLLERPAGWRSLGDGADRDEPHPIERGNRRRLATFLLAFALVMLVGQSWNLGRDAEYRATTRLQVSLPDVAGAGAASSAAYTTQLERITGRAVLSRVVDHLPAAVDGSDGAGHPKDRVAELQAMLQVVPVAGSEVVQVVATGPAPERLAAVLNALRTVGPTASLVRVGAGGGGTMRGP